VEHTDFWNHGINPITGFEVNTTDVTKCFWQKHVQYFMAFYIPQKHVNIEDQIDELIYYESFHNFGKTKIVIK